MGSARAVGAKTMPFSLGCRGPASRRPTVFVRYRCFCDQILAWATGRWVRRRCTPRQTGKTSLSLSQNTSARPWRLAPEKFALNRLRRNSTRSSIKIVRSSFVSSFARTPETAKQWPRESFGIGLMTLTRWFQKIMSAANSPLDSLFCWAALSASQWNSWAKRPRKYLTELRPRKHLIEPRN